MDQFGRSGCTSTSTRVRSGRAIGDDSFFRVVLDLHRRLFIGTTGRAVVETVTCWTIILLVTGLFLWFPRRASVRGCICVRLWAKPYTVLRDLHAIAGVLLVPIALTITLTGLVYSLVWGSGYSYARRAASLTLGQTNRFRLLTRCHCR